MKIFDLKHIHCMDDKENGCGLLFTSPTECNDNTEFPHHAKILHVKIPEVIDKKTKQLRQMNEEELKDHKDNLQKTLQEHLKSYKKKYPKNEWSVIQLDDTDTHYVHEFKVEPEFGKYEKTEDSLEISRVEKADIILVTTKTTTTHILRCKSCKKEAIRSVFETLTTKEISKPKKIKK